MELCNRHITSLCHCVKRYSVWNNLPLSISMPSDICNFIMLPFSYGIELAFCRGYKIALYASWNLIIHTIFPVVE